MKKLALYKCFNPRTHTGCDNEEYLKEKSVVYAISFNGKARYNLELPADISKEDAEKAALNHENSAKWMEGKTVKKVIVVPGKIVNIVVG